MIKVLVDNGHGVETPGKRSPDGRLREYKYAREIASSVVSRLKERGYDAALIVEEDRDISLQDRCKRVNNWCELKGNKNVILVSVHVNAAGNGEWMNATGWSAYTSIGQTSADKLADCLVIRSRKHDIEEDILQDAANASGSDTALDGKVCHMFDCIRREFQQDVILAKQAGIFPCDSILRLSQNMAQIIPGQILQLNQNRQASEQFRGHAIAPQKFR